MGEPRSCLPYFWSVLAIATGLLARAEAAPQFYSPLAEEAPPRNAALFVGVGAFAEDASLRALPCAVNDAVSQAHLFVNDLKLIPASNCYLALSGEPTSELAKAQLAVLIRAGAHKISASKLAILRAMAAIVLLADDPGNLLLFSIGSHGFEEKGIPYAMPGDGVKTFLRDSALDLLSVQERLTQSKAQRRLMFLDVCREDSVVDGNRERQTMSPAYRDGLARIVGVGILASCDAGQVSIDNPDVNYGLFTHALIAALHNQAKGNARGQITLGAVTECAVDLAAKWIAAKRPNMEKAVIPQPWFSGSVAVERMPLALDTALAQRQQAFRGDLQRAIAALRVRITPQGPFTSATFEQLNALLEQAVGDDDGRALLANCQSLAGGAMGEGAFVAFVQQATEKKRPGAPFRGFTIQIHRVDWMAKYKACIDDIAAIGADTVQLQAMIWQEHAGSPACSMDPRATPTLRQMGELIDHARERKLRAVVMPMVLLREPRGNEWRGVISPPSWPDWFAVYRQTINRFAATAQEHQAEVFFVGAELVSSQKEVEEWRRTIAEARGVYRGQVTYCANWDNYESIEFWPNLDYIAMNSYWTFGENRNVAVPEIRGRWTKIQNDALAFSHKQGKPLYFGEVAWLSAANAASSPWDYTRNEEVDLDLQKRLFESFFQTWHGHPRLAGYMIFDWSPDPAGPEDRGYTVKGKPSQNLVEKYLKKAWRERD